MKKSGINFILFISISFLFLFLIQLSTAQYLPQEQNTPLYYSFTSNNATECNVTTGNTPYGLVDINQIATRNGQTFNITINESKFTSLGDYCFNIICTDGSQYETGSVCRTVTGNGNNAPDGIVIVLFSIIFIIIMVMLLYELIVGIGHFASLDLDIVDVAKSMGTYFGLFALYELAQFYLGNPDIESWLLLFIKIGGFTNVLIPIIGFLISITVGSLSKKKIDFGTKRIMGRQFKIGKV